MYSSTAQCQGDLSSGQKGPWDSLASFCPAPVIFIALGCVQNTQAETPTQCMDKFGGAQHCHPSVYHGSSKNPLPPPLHHSLSMGPEGIHSSSPHRDGGQVWPIWMYFLFYKFSALEMDFFSLGTVTRTRAEQEQLAEKTKRATMCFQPCPAVTCFNRNPRKLQYHPDMSCVHVTP